MNKLNYLRVAAVNPNLKIGNPSHNQIEIINQINYAATHQVEVIVFPELSITGYTCGDLFNQDVLIKNSLAALKNIMNATNKLNIISIIGLPIVINQQLYNAAAIIYKGEILGIVPKTHIPNYREFYEKRWFNSANDLNVKEVKIFERLVPAGNDLLFVDQHSNSFGVEICEDLWHPESPSINYSLNGASTIFNLSASNHLIGKSEERLSLITEHAKKCNIGYVYASSGNDESSTDLVFSGHLIINEKGQTLSNTVDEQFVYNDLDLDVINHDKKQMGNLFNKQNVRYIYFNKEDVEFKTIRSYQPNPFLPHNAVLLDKRAAEIIDIQTSGLVTRIKNTGIDKLVIGMSGGLDSTLAFLVAVNALNKLDISLKNIIAVTMPGFGTTDRTYQNAIALIKSFKTTFLEISINDAVQQHFKDIKHDPNVHDLTYENSQARERTQILMDLANQHNALVLGTGDLSELALGWCTYNGDHMSMYNVNASIPKTLVKFLVNWYQENKTNPKQSLILKDIVNTPISPELIPGKQETEKIVGAYEVNDFFMYYMIRFGLAPQKLLAISAIAFKDKYSETELKLQLKAFITRFFRNQFKRSAMPDGPKVGSVSLSPRGDWRMPSDISFKEWIDDLE